MKQFKSWIKSFIISRSKTNTCAKVIKTVKGKGKRSDGSLVKITTDGDVSIKTVFTTLSLESITEDDLSQSENWNSAVLILLAFRVELEGIQSTYPEYVLVVDKFRLWDLQPGFEGTSAYSIRPCMECHDIRETCLEDLARAREENATDEVEEQTEQSHDPLSELLEEMARASPESQPTEAGNLTEAPCSTRNQSVAMPAVAGFVGNSCPASLLQSLFHPFTVKKFLIPLDQQQQLHQVKEWQQDYVPSVSVKSDDGSGSKELQSGPQLQLHCPTLIEAGQRSRSQNRDKGTLGDLPICSNTQSTQASQESESKWQNELDSLHFSDESVDFGSPDAHSTQLEPPVHLQDSRQPQSLKSKESGVSNTVKSCISNTGKSVVSNTVKSCISNTGKSVVSNMDKSGVSNTVKSDVSNAGTSGVSTRAKSDVSNAGTSGVSTRAKPDVSNAGTSGVSTRAKSDVSNARTSGVSTRAKSDVSNAGTSGVSTRAKSDVSNARTSGVSTRAKSDVSNAGTSGVSTRAKLSVSKTEKLSVSNTEKSSVSNTTKSGVSNTKNYRFSNTQKSCVSITEKSDVIKIKKLGMLNTADSAPTRKSERLNKSIGLEQCESTSNKDQQSCRKSVRKTNTTEIHVSQEVRSDRSEEDDCIEASLNKQSNSIHSNFESSDRSVISPSPEATNSVSLLLGTASMSQNTKLSTNLFASSNSRGHLSSKIEQIIQLRANSSCYSELLIVKPIGDRSTNHPHTTRSDKRSRKGFYRVESSNSSNSTSSPGEMARITGRPEMRTEPGITDSQSNSETVLQQPGTESITDDSHKPSAKPRDECSQNVSQTLTNSKAAELGRGKESSEETLYPQSSASQQKHSSSVSSSQSHDELEMTDTGLVNTCGGTSDVDKSQNQNTLNNHSEKCFAIAYQRSVGESALMDSSNMTRVSGEVTTDREDGQYTSMRNSDSILRERKIANIPLEESNDCQPELQEHEMDMDVVGDSRKRSIKLQKKVYEARKQDSVYAQSVCTNSDSVTLPVDKSVDKSGNVPRLSTWEASYLAWVNIKQNKSDNAINKTKPFSGLHDTSCVSSEASNDLSNTANTHVSNTANTLVSNTANTNVSNTANTDLSNTANTDVSNTDVSNTANNDLSNTANNDLSNTANNDLSNDALVSTMKNTVVSVTSSLELFDPVSHFSSTQTFDVVTSSREATGQFDTADQFPSTQPFNVSLSNKKTAGQCDTAEHFPSTQPFDVGQELSQGFVPDFNRTLSTETTVSCENSQFKSSHKIDGTQDTVVQNEEFTKIVTSSNDMRTSKIEATQTNDKENKKTDSGWISTKKGSGRLAQFISQSVATSANQASAKATVKKQSVDMIEEGQWGSLKRKLRSDVDDGSSSSDSDDDRSILQRPAEKVMKYVRDGDNNLYRTTCDQKYVCQDSQSDRTGSTEARTVKHRLSLKRRRNTELDCTLRSQTEVLHAKDGPVQANIRVVSPQSKSPGVIVISSGESQDMTQGSPQGSTQKSLRGPAQSSSKGSSSSSQKSSRCSSPSSTHSSTSASLQSINPEDVPIEDLAQYEWRRFLTFLKVDETTEAGRELAAMKKRVLDNLDMDG